MPLAKGNVAALNEHSAVEAAAFNQQRLNAVESVLAAQPCAVITGLSGVGKSTFVKEVLAKKHQVYYGERQMRAWAQAKESERPLLFIDEMNLGGRDWSEFEGLFENPPRVLIDGVLCTLSPGHCVVGAMNPNNYGGERCVPSLLLRHGSALAFEPLPAANLYEEVLKPVFSGLGCSEERVRAVCSHILEVYAFFVAHSTTEVLISPRELQMMALLMYARMSQHPGDVLATARYYAYHLARHLVPSGLSMEFDRAFKGEQAAPKTTILSQDYMITHSRQNALQLLNDFLGLRNLRCTTPGLNDAQRYGGLGGLILEGEPGMGKSELVIHSLRAHGFQEVHGQGPIPPKPFYKLPVSLSLKEKEAILYKAFNEGAVVVIDEINTAPLMERLLNSLLMGTTPEGQRPAKPGFMVIGTRNPPTMEGRLLPSTALDRRMVTVSLPEYSRAEMEALLRFKSIPLKDIEPMVSGFIKNREFAQSKGLPLPSFRDLLKYAERLSPPRSQLTVPSTPTQSLMPPPATRLMLPPAQSSLAVVSSVTFFRKQSSRISGAISPPSKLKCFKSEDSDDQNSDDPSFMQWMEVKKNKRTASKALDSSAEEPDTKQYRSEKSAGGGKDSDHISLKFGFS